jgi:anaerobic ribonucleoside-triphosphate reductase activating protein
MIKYLNYAVVFEEMPKHLSLAINITNCQNRCVGCHTPELREDIGQELTTDELDKLIHENEGINCVIFMGEGNDRNELCRLSQYVREKFGITTCLYSGKPNLEQYMIDNFDYVKIGPYIEKYGPLNSPTTNQRLYKIVGDTKIDVTKEFWK